MGEHMQRGTTSNELTAVLLGLGNDGTSLHISQALAQALPHSTAAHKHTKSGSESEDGVPKQEQLWEVRVCAHLSRISAPKPCIHSLDSLCGVMEQVSAHDNDSSWSGQRWYPTTKHLRHSSIK